MENRTLLARLLGDNLACLHLVLFSVLGPNAKRGTNLHLDPAKYRSAILQLNCLKRIRLKKSPSLYENTINV